MQHLLIIHVTYINNDLVWNCATCRDENVPVVAMKTVWTCTSCVRTQNVTTLMCTIQWLNGNLSMGTHEAMLQRGYRFNSGYNAAESRRSLTKKITGGLRRNPRCYQRRRHGSYNQQLWMDQVALDCSQPFTAASTPPNSPFDNEAFTGANTGEQSKTLSKGCE